MLKRADENNFSEIRGLCKGSIIGTRILCYIMAYGFDRDFLEVWIIENNGVTVGVFTKFYDDITLLVNDRADIGQISAFLQMFYFKTLMCHSFVGDALGFESSITKAGYRFCGYTDDAKTDSLTENDIEKAYALISREIPGSFSSDREAYLSFLSDFTFRQRRGLARGVCTHNGVNVSSVALTSSETDNAAIISGVACDRSLQKKGLGKKTVLSLADLLRKENKDIYVIALNESAQGFYEHIGFEKTEKIAFVERESYV